jgi:hypothetical protein
MRSVIGLSGYAGSGKDTVADFLIEKRGWTGKTSFARNLKDLVKAVFKLSEYEVSDHNGKKSKFNAPLILNSSHVGAILVWMTRTHKNLSPESPSKETLKEFFLSVAGKSFETPREILQFVGTDFCRYIIPTYHTDVLKTFLSSQEGNWVVTDVRFPNEAQVIKDFNGALIKIERPDLEHSVVHRHESEVALSSWSDWDATIVNDASSIEDLYSKVDKFLEENQLCQIIQ